MYEQRITGRLLPESVKIEILESCKGKKFDRNDLFKFSTTHYLYCRVLYLEKKFRIWYILRPWRLKIAVIIKTYELEFVIVAR